MAVIKQKKRYRRPKNPFEKERIEEENALIKKYGLKNKREIWKAESAVEKIRSQAKRLITAPTQEQQGFINKLIKMGTLKAGSQIDDVLALTKEALLERRFQTLVMKKFSKSPLHARQLVVHRHIAIGDRIINIPSYIVSLEEEKDVKIVKKAKAEKKEEIKPEKEAKGEVKEKEEAKQEGGEKGEEKK